MLTTHSTRKMKNAADDSAVNVGSAVFGNAISRRSSPNSAYTVATVVTVITNVPCIWRLT